MRNSERGMKTGELAETSSLAWLLLLVSLSPCLLVLTLLLAANLLRSVYRIHADGDALVRPNHHGLRCFLNRFVDHILFAGLEPAQHVIDRGYIVLQARGIHADAKPAILGRAELILNVPQTVVPAG